MSATVTEVPTMRAFDVEVSAVRRLSPSFVRVTFAGDDLRHIGTGGPAGPRDLRVKLLVPVGGAAAVDADAAPDLNAWGFRPGWYRDWLAVDESVRGVMRTYTARALRPAVGEIDVDFVLHVEPDGASGPAAAWAAAARPGDRMTIIGPDGRSALTVGIEWEPRDCRRVLLAGDETAVPAIAAILEGLPRDVEGEALLEVPHAEDAQELDAPPGVRVSWLARGDRLHGALLRPAVHLVVRGARQADVAAEDDIDVDTSILWDTPAHPLSAVAPGSAETVLAEPCDDDRVYAWVAGEAAMVRDLRRHLIGAGFPRSDVAFMGYWRQGRAEPS